MHSAPGTGTAYFINAAESLVFCAGEHKPDRKINCFAAHTIILTKDVLPSPALPGLCAEVFAFAYTAFGIC